MSLRKQQIHAINGIADHPLCVVNHFCGTGKTHIMKALLQMMTMGEIAILVFPSLALIHQFHSNYASQLQQFKWLTVCSAEQDVGFFLPHTTQLQKVIDFLKREDSRVLTVTYDSLPIVLSAISPPILDEDENELSDVNDLKSEIVVRYLMFDEAHHVTEKRNRKLLWKDNVWQVTNVKQTIFFTASLRNKSGIIMDPEQSSRINATWEKYDILPQQDEKEDIMDGHCGPIVSRYTHREAVLDGTCNDFALRCDFGISRSNICREQIVLESILRAMMTNSQSRALTFHSSIVKGVNVFTNDLLMAAWEYLGKPDGFAIPEIIHLNASTQDRPKLLAKFESVPDHGIGENQLVILASCRTIGEGIDTKRAEVVVFADPKKSQIDIMQNIGRVCRAYDGMRVATVLIPVVVNKEKYMEVQDDDVKRDELIREDLNKGGDFNAILRVSSALRQYDPNLYNLCWCFPRCFSPVEVKENLIRQGCSTMNDDDNHNLTQVNEVLQQYQNMTDVCIAMTNFSHEIGRPIEVHTTSMEKPIQIFGTGESDPIIVVYDEKQSTYELLQKNTNKRLESPKRKPVQVHMDHETMILWHTTDALDFVAKNTQTAILSSAVRCVSWETRLASFMQFLSENGKYPSTIKDSAERQIAEWVHTQRKNKDKMYIERKTRLDAIKFVWDMKDGWSNKLEDLIQWLSNSGGKYPSARSEDIKEKTIGCWVNNQRQQKENMSEDQKAKLDNIRFMWKTGSSWESKLQAFVQWLSKTGGKYPSQHSENITEKKIAFWVSTQRMNKDIMSDDRKVDLGKIPFIWKIEDSFPNKLEELVKWLTISDGKYPSSKSKNVTEKTLANWVCIQRAGKNMTDDRKAALNKISFIWNKGDLWQTKFQDLVDWLSKNDGKYPIQHSKDLLEKKIGCWVKTQRENEYTMSVDHKSKLKEIRFAWGVHIAKPKLSSNVTTCVMPTWFALCIDITKLLVGVPSAPTTNLLAYLTGDKSQATDVFDIYGSMKFKEALSTMLQDIQTTKFTKKLIDPMICESKVNCNECGSKSIFHLVLLSDIILNLASYDTICENCTKPTKQQIVKLGMKCLVLCNTESNFELPSSFVFKNFNYSRVCGIEESKTGEWSKTTIPDFIGKMVHCVVYERGKLANKLNGEPQKKRAKKSNDKKDSTKSSDSIPIISNAEYLEEKTLSLNESIELANLALSPNKRKLINNNETAKKKHRSLLLQLQTEKDKIAQKQQTLEETERLFALKNPTKEEEYQLCILKRQLGFVEDSYNESIHSDSHATWKQDMNMVFTELVSDFTHIGDNILYLDGEQQHTTTTLRSRFGNTRKLFVANWSQETCDNLEITGKIDEIQHGSVKNILDGHWQNQIFAAAYLDLCTGSTSAISEVLTLLLHSRNICKVVGFTMTQRDPEGYNQVERLDRLESVLRNLCPRMTRVTDFPKFKDTIWIDGGVVTRFYVIG
jgi:superfamily II DNA or RNA helicase